MIVLEVHHRSTGKVAYYVTDEWDVEEATTRLKRDAMVVRQHNAQRAPATLGRWVVGE